VSQKLIGCFKIRREEEEKQVGGGEEEAK